MAKLHTHTAVARLPGVS